MLWGIGLTTLIAVIAISCSKEMNKPGTELASCGTCNWYGTNYPVCCSTTSGWGWENNASCIAAATCTGSGQSCSGCSGSGGSSGGSSGGGTILNDGVNLQPDYYNCTTNNVGWSLMKSESKIKTVRIMITTNGSYYSLAKTKAIIASAKSNGYNVICAIQGYTGSDNLSDLETAANYWKTNYSTLAASGSFTINLCNEWGDHNITASTFASYYNTAIAIVRSVYSGTIIIDIPGWGQETLTAYNAIKGSGTVITDGNICLSTHIYPGNYNQGRGHTYQASDMADLLNTGKPVMIGEFGTGSGSCDWSGCVSQGASYGWSRLAWAWNGDGGSLNMVTPSWSSNPTATSWSTNSYFTTVYAKL